MNDDFSALAGFSGVARLFPLPNLVFFPHVMQPLHIFEPRYRQMTTEALAGDRLIALALPLPGWETAYAGSPGLHSVACLGKVVADQKLEDGRFNILLRGLSRVQIVKEISHGKLYRKAKVDLLAEVPVSDPKNERRLRRHLSEKVPHWVEQQGEMLDQFEKLLHSDLSLGALCDIFAFALPLDVSCKQALLEELEVEQRLRRLFEGLETKPAPQIQTPRKFPPEFSAN